jgi:hypothetical protein
VLEPKAPPEEVLEDAAFPPPNKPLADEFDVLVGGGKREFPKPLGPEVFPVLLALLALLAPNPAVPPGGKRGMGVEAFGAWTAIPGVD